MSIKKLFNDNWEFTKQPINTEYEDIRTEGTAWERVTLPHDWLIFDAKNLYEDSYGWYKKRFSYQPNSQERVLINFDGIYMDSNVYINGETAGEWKYGYSAFEIDITDYLRNGENEIMVLARFRAPNSRWYSGAGIYRDVVLKTVNVNHIATDGVYISVFNENDNSWRVELDTELKLANSTTEKNIIVKHMIYKKNKGEEWGADVVVTTEVPYCSSKLTAQASQRDESQITNVTGTEVLKCNTSVRVKNPDLWDIESPNLYTVETSLIINGITVDTEYNTFGFRTIEFTTDRGFFLNGHHVKLKGVCEHHDHGCLGAVFNKTAMVRKLKILREMGVNAIRTSHNMPAKAFMELTDELGFLVDSEGFDIWERPKNEFDYARFFIEWAERDVASWIRRDRNHPSVIMWSIGNEIYDTHADVHGEEITRRLLSFVREHDYKDNCPVTIASNYMPWEGAQNCADIVKLAGYNYAEKCYEEHHKLHPDWMIYGSETASTAQSRGVYHFPVSTAILADDDEQCSSLGNCTTSWGAKNADACVVTERDTIYSAGQFLWSGFDYIGEPTPYHTKNSYLGQIDTAGFPKDTYYIYKAGWNEYNKEKVLHVFPYWDFNEGQIIDIGVVTNCPSVELFLNGISQGIKTVDTEHDTILTKYWQVPYTKGCIKAVAYDNDGHIVLEEEKHSFGEAAELVLAADKYEMAADGMDLIFIEINMKDKDGYIVENASSRVNVLVNGQGRLIGLDNGDSTDYEQYKCYSRRLFSGKLLAVIGSTLTPGEIEVKVESEGIKTAIIYLRSSSLRVEECSGENKGQERYVRSGEVRREEMSYGKSGEVRTPEFTQFTHEVPVRKLELYREYSSFTCERRSITVKAKILPENASYKDVIWTVVNDAGIPSNLAKLEKDDNGVKVTAIGDGDFRLRCMSKNGWNGIRIISVLEFTADGIGQAHLNPYEFISAGLYTKRKGNIGNGNDKGIATDNKECYIGFENIDFGCFGSDTITLPIFTLSGEVYSFELWEGVPETEGSILLGSFTYKKETIWNVYQPETYKLNRRVKGITSIFLRTFRKFHVKGFLFEKQEKAFSRINACDYDRIYGDTYKIYGTNVGEIGNNVTLEFDDMDFGSRAVMTIKIFGNSPIEKNTIHIHAYDGSTDNEQLVEFTQTDGYTEKTFKIQPISGRHRLSFVFLPGSRFDFGYFEFT